MLGAMLYYLIYEVEIKKAIKFLKDSYLII